MNSCAQMSARCPCRTCCWGSSASISSLTIWGRMGFGSRGLWATSYSLDCVPAVFEAIRICTGTDAYAFSGGYERFRCSPPLPHIRQHRELQLLVRPLALVATWTWRVQAEASRFAAKAVQDDATQPIRLALLHRRLRRSPDGLPCEVVCSCVGLSRCRPWGPYRQRLQLCR